MKFNRWDIWWAYVKYEESNIEKRRPIVVIDDRTAFVLGLFVTSASPRPQYDDYIIQDWEEAGLSKPSTIKLSRRLRLDKDKLISRIGEMSERDKLIRAMRAQMRL